MGANRADKIPVSSSGFCDSVMFSDTNNLREEQGCGMLCLGVSGLDENYPRRVRRGDLVPGLSNHHIPEALPSLAV